MELLGFDDKRVRITLHSGEAFDGACLFDGAEYCLHEFGREEDALEIDGWLFYESEIAAVTERPEAPRLWMGKPLHHMRLHPEPFAMIESGQKTIELRLYDEKRKALHVGDIIRLVNMADDEEVLYCRVDRLQVFLSFADLYRALPLTACGYTAETVKDASPTDMNAYYTQEEQQRCGAVGIHLTVL